MIGCVIQGDIRRGTDLLLKELPNKFDFVVLSTWVDDESKVPPGNYSLVLNSKPTVGGLTNRNYQRLSTARGIQSAKEAGCDYVLKWRTDMLPTKLDIKQLLSWTNYKIPNGLKSRLVMPAFRNLSVNPDWFSSIPDLFAFGHIEEMEMLWDDAAFNYSLNFNLPSQMANDLKINPIDSMHLSNLYCPESELYAIFRSRLQIKLGIELDHSKIASDYLRLFNYHQLGIFWFDKKSGFRSIGQAWEHPWWTESTWKRGSPLIVPCGYSVNGLSANVRKVTSPLRISFDQLRQKLCWYLINF